MASPAAAVGAGAVPPPPGPPPTPLAAAVAATPDLTALQWSDKTWLSYLSLNATTALDYFSLSPFYDASCNNELVKMQRLDPAAILPTMTGVEYSVEPVPPDREPARIYIVHKGYRSGPAAADVTPLATFYIDAGGVYQAPAVAGVLSCVVRSSLDAVGRAWAAVHAAAAVECSAPGGFVWRPPPGGAGGSGGAAAAATSAAAAAAGDADGREGANVAERRVVDGLLVGLVDGNHRMATAAGEVGEAPVPGGGEGGGGRGGRRGGGTPWLSEGWGRGRGGGGGAAVTAPHTATAVRSRPSTRPSARPWPGGLRPLCISLTTARYRGPTPLLGGSGSVPHSSRTKMGAPPGRRPVSRCRSTTGAWRAAAHRRGTVSRGTADAVPVGVPDTRRPERVRSRPPRGHPVRGFPPTRGRASSVGVGGRARLTWHTRAGSVRAAGRRGGGARPAAGPGRRLARPPRDAPRRVPVPLSPARTYPECAHTPPA